MIRKADASQGFFPEKVMKTVIRGEFTDEQMDTIVAVLQSPELSKDQMEWGVSRIPFVSPEAASILIQTWFDGGKNKMKWEEKQLKTWIQGQLTTKIGDSMNRIASELLKVAKELVVTAEQVVVAGMTKFTLKEISLTSLEIRLETVVKLSVPVKEVGGNKETQEYRDKLNQVKRDADTLIPRLNIVLNGFGFSIPSYSKSRLSVNPPPWHGDAWTISVEFNMISTIDTTMIENAVRKVI